MTPLRGAVYEMAPVEIRENQPAMAIHENMDANSARDEKRADYPDPIITDKGLSRAKFQMKKCSLKTSRSKKLIGMHKVKDIVIKPVPVSTTAKSRATSSTKTASTTRQRFFYRQDL